MTWNTTPPPRKYPARNKTCQLHKLKIVYSKLRAFKINNIKNAHALLGRLLFEDGWMITKVSGAPSNQRTSTCHLRNFFFVIPRECLQKSFGMTYQRLEQNVPNPPRKFFRNFQKAASVPTVGNFSLKWRVGSGITAPASATRSLEFGIFSAIS